MGIQLNKNDVHILKYLAFYKVLSISVMVISGLLNLSQIYARFFKDKSEGETILINALIGSALVVFTCGYFMHLFLRLIEKLNVLKQGNNAKTV